MTGQSLFIYLGFFSLFLLPNHDFFNFIVVGTPLIIWKQFLAALLYILALSLVILNRNGPRILKREGRLLLMLTVNALILVVMSFVMGLSAHRVIYGLIAYIGFSGMLIFPFTISKFCSEETVFKVVAIIAYIASIGIILDYFTPALDFLPRSNGNEFKAGSSGIHLRRAAFLFGASTTVFQYLSFGLISFAILFFRRNGFSKPFWLFSFLIISTSAIFLTGSSSNVFLYSLLAAFILLFLIRSKGLGRKMRLLGPILIMGSLVPSILVAYVPQYLDLLAKYQNVISSSTGGNNIRFLRWSQGLELFNNFRLESIVGHGLGSTLGMVKDGFDYSTHYESSFFQAYYEGGILGLLLRYVPLIYTLFALAKSPVRHDPKILLICVWLIFYAISTSVAPTAAAYHTQAIYFLACGLILRSVYDRRSNFHRKID